MTNPTKLRKPGHSVDTWAILCLVALVVITAVYWGTHP
ncbi:UNVERIFIED_ORG: hypothetical protein J2W65_001271 [Pseudomonas parafulva]|jgi:hypothetical protein|nr:putative membrane protein [Pseudomonas putida S610]MDP9555668.1 hypothetical protein [Pseudomonas parafulva]MDP9665139.1 hypothetical protein [Pseudomonas cremoricolorata]PZW58671.1 hypothetical protein F478_00679 [Pseudomonas sp. URIL14HWK12:I2]PZW59131.1 hypothetical protein F477_01516 [Pseudomonas sp. URIL14HWK12:I3]RDL19574.1 hypothetical protein F633_02402 [Pseudomonas sp. LAMO17WK12:I3]RED10510.1 hypothetical protein D884_02234 [Pseudomonas sp. URMO17WK12:I10]TCT93232.1 hypothetical